MNADDYMPDAATVAAIEKDIANYNTRRAHARREIDRRMPMLLGLYALGCFAAFVLLLANFGSLPEKLAMFLLVGGGIGAIAGGVGVANYARRPGVDTQQQFRNHMLPVLFGFVENLRYSQGYEPRSFSRMPDAVKGSFNKKTFGDIITGRLGDKRFEIYETTLVYNSKNSSTVAFKGLVLGCGTAEEMPGTLVAVRRPPSDFKQSVDALMRSLSGLFGGQRLETVLSRSRLDNTYEFITDRPDEARALLKGRTGEVLAWVNQTWRSDRPRLAVRRAELFVLLPSTKDFFELPPLERPLDYGAHLAPMVRDFASLLAIVEEVQRGPLPVPDPGEVQAAALTEEPAEAAEEGFVRLLDDVPPVDNKN